MTDLITPFPPGGMTDSEPGHRLEWQVVVQPYSTSSNFKVLHALCSCGEAFNAGHTYDDGSKWTLRLDKDGRANARLVAAWRGHLDSVANAGSVVEVGIIHKARVDIHYSVMTGEAAEENDFASPYSFRPDLYPAWSVCETSVARTSGKVTRKRVRIGYTTKEAALQKADNIVTHGQDSGYRVTFIREESVKESPQGVTFRFVELADGALASRSLHDIERAKKDLDDFFSLLPIIEAKRDALEELRNELVLG